ncbi:MAG: TraR/DksA C4-type zinc finger protein, partial [Candidatus Dormiibacterota bacterium]
MIDNEIERLRELEQNRERLSTLFKAFKADAGLERPLAESNGDVITHDYDDTDFAALLSDRDMSDRLLHVLDTNRDQFEHALERLAQGLYGVCEDCGTTIPTERLHFKPEATRCVACQS